MEDFIEMNCRLCKKVFCCKKCREKHEKEVHHIHPDCDICIYGKTTVLFTSASLIEHIKTVHWPLHCLVCKRFFGPVDELFQHSKCSFGSKTTDVSEKSPYTPGHSKFTEQFFDSPPLLSCTDEKGQSSNKNLRVISNLATSTPMQKEDNHLLEKIQQVIVTPVDSESINKDSITKKDQDPKQNNTGSLKKRRVTFGETTEHTDNPYNQSQYSCHYKQKNMSTHEHSPSSEHFYSAEEEQSSQSEFHQKENTNVNSNLPTIRITESPQSNKTKNIPEDEKPSYDEETVWTSAINKSASFIEETESPSWEASATPELNQFATPMLPHYKNKQVNFVVPTPLKIKEETCIKFLGPVQISSTPNSSIIPVQSAPNHRDIFRSEEYLPSTSKSGIDTSDSILKKNQPQNRIVSSEITESYKDIAGDLCCSSSSARLWSSVSRIVKNVTDALNGFASVDGIALPKPPSSMKRHYSDYDHVDGPCSPKRYKLTKIKCRRPIRELPVTYLSRDRHLIESTRKMHINIEKDEGSSVIAKSFVDKATQTDEFVSFEYKS